MPEPTLPPSTAGPSTGSHAPLRRGPLWRGCLYFAYLIMALLIVDGIVSAVLTYGSTGVYGELERLRAAGAPISVGQAAPPLIPADHNAAPLYLEAAKLLQPHEDRYPSLGAKADKDGVQWQPDNRLWGAYVNWSDPETVRALSAMVKSDEKPLQLLCQAAARPGCRFDLKWSEGINMRLSHLSRLRAMSRFCAVATAVAAVEGNGELTGQRLHANVVLACHASQEPTVISQTVTYAIVAIAERSAEVALSRVVVPEPQARAILSQVTSLDLATSTVLALRTDRAMDIELYDMARRDPMSAINLLGILLDKPRDGAWCLAVRCVPGLLSADELSYLQLAERSLVIATLPWAEAKREMQTLAKWGKEHLKYTRIARHVGIVWYKPSQRRFECQANLNLLCGGLGLGLYKQKTGRYPQSLDALAQINWPVPQDPFTDAPMKYKLQGDRYLLYSVGPDGDDDGGRLLWRLTPDPSKAPPDADRDDGDLPWQWR
ncbi:hypothetical protein LLH03_10565 [bacterium]|nr:hypothetical protein [bacterium]